MANRLTKNFNYTYTPGSPGVLDTPATPYIPGYWSTVTTCGSAIVSGDGCFVQFVGSAPVMEWSDATHYAQPLIMNGQLVGWRVCPKAQCYTSQVYQPAVPATPGTAPIPPTPAQVIADNNQGWNAGALSSVALLPGQNSGFRFKIFKGSAGVGIGLATYNEHTSVNDIHRGFLWTSAGGLQIIEGGVFRYSAATLFDEGAYLRIEREGTTVRYYVQDVLARTHTISAAETYYLDAHLYQAGDYVEDPDMYDIVAMSINDSAATSFKLSGDLRCDISANTSAVAEIRKNSDVDLRLVNAASTDTYANALSERALSVAALASTTQSARLATDGGDTSTAYLQAFASDTVRAGAASTTSYLVGEAYSSYFVVRPQGVNSVSYPLISNSLCLTGELGFVEEAASQPVIGLSADRSYAGSETSMVPLTGVAYCENPLEANLITYLFAITGLDTINDLYVVMRSDMSVATLVAATKVSGADATSTATVGDTMLPQSVMLAEILSALNISAGTGVEDSEASVWVVNLTNGATTRYENYSFSQYMNIGGKLYGVKQDGVYLLGSSATDDGADIRASVDFGKEDFGVTEHKALQAVYLGVKSDGKLYVRVVDDSDNAYFYPVAASAVMNTVRATTGRGLKANYYSLQLHNEGGADFELAEAEFLAVPLNRRV